MPTRTEAPGRSFALLSICVALALAVLLGLGTWQIQRLQWKNDLIARVEARVKLPPAPLTSPSDWAGLDLEALEYRPFTVAGRFDHAAEIHVFTSLPDPRGSRSGPGYWVMTPLDLEGGGQLWINRGFVPEALKSPDARNREPSDAPVRLVGLLRRAEPGNAFTPEPDIAGNVWFIRDPIPMSAARGLAAAAPFFLDALESPPGGVPQAGETRMSFRNSHLEYALTWYGLALALIAVYLAYLRTARRRSEPEERP